jgi:hypothetical protein
VRTVQTVASLACRASSKRAVLSVTALVCCRSDMPLSREAPQSADGTEGRPEYVTSPATVTDSVRVGANTCRLIAADRSCNAPGRCARWRAAHAGRHVRIRPLRRFWRLAASFRGSAGAVRAHRRPIHGGADPAHPCAAQCRTALCRVRKLGAVAGTRVGYVRWLVTFLLVCLGLVSRNGTPAGHCLSCSQGVTNQRAGSKFAFLPSLKNS